MGKIYELFGSQEPYIVEKLPNKRLRKSISSGNYGYKRTIFKQNPLFLYLVDPSNAKNIVYWYDKIVHDQFEWTEMHKYFVDIGLIRIGGFHPWNYGYGDRGCPVGYDCGECHKEALGELYRYYRRRNNCKYIL